MVSKPSSRQRFAVLDLDETLIEGTIGSKIARYLIDPRKTKGVLPRRYYITFLRFGHLPLLTKLKRFYRVYRYLLRRSYAIYRKLLEDPKVDKERLREIISKVVSETEIPEISTAFIKKLKEKGYTVVLLTATPQEIAELMGKRLGVDIIIGSRPDRILDREGKEAVLRELKKKGKIDIIVGNPGNEPFWMAERLAIIVRSPIDLKRWLEKI